MFTTTGTDSKAHIIISVLLTAVAAMVPAQWLTDAKRARSFAVYYVGYRLLSVQISCGSLAVSGMPLVLKYATR